MWFLGIDGGGTHTRIEVRDGENRFLWREEFGPFNLNSIGEAAFRERLREIFARCGGMADCGGICAGGAGVSNPRVGEIFREELESAGFSGKQKLCGDQEIALRGAMDGAGVILISGTGSICFGRNGQGQTCRSGGYGHLIDDGGSGYALGRDALSAAVRTLDGRTGGSEVLLKRICSAISADTPEALIAWVYSPGTEKADVARLSRLVLENAESDPVSRQILERGVEELCGMVSAVQCRLGLAGCPIALMGGLLEQESVYRSMAAEKLSLLGSVISPAHDALWGAAQLAYEL